MTTGLPSSSPMSTTSNLTNSTMHFPPPWHFNLGVIIVIGVLIVLTFLGNTLVCVAFIKLPRMRTATNCFLFSLAVSDLAVGLILMPLFIARTVVGLQNISGKLWTVCSMLDISCSVASMTNLASVSVERWYGVSYPFRHMSMRTRTAFLLACASWLYAVGTSLIYLAEAKWPGAVITVLGLCLPFLLMTLSYCGIARKIRQKTFSRKHQSGRELKTIRTLILVSVVFLVCWFPFVVGSLVVNYCDACARYVNHRPLLRIFPKVLHYSNSCVNPILYALLSPSFKSAFQQLFRGTRRDKMSSRRLRANSFEPSRSESRTKKLSLSTSFKEKRTLSLVQSDRNRNSLNSIKLVECHLVKF